MKLQIVLIDKDFFKKMKYFLHEWIDLVRLIW